MISITRIYCYRFCSLVILLFLVGLFSPSALADGGAPQLAYVAVAAQGIDIIDGDWKADDPLSEVLLDPRRKGQQRVRLGAFQILSRQLDHWHWVAWHGEPTPLTVVGCGAISLRCMHDRDALIRSLRKNF